MIAYCGLECESCPIHSATLEKDRSSQLTMRVSIAQQCSERYGMTMKPDDITDCDGCIVDSGRLFSGCLKCEIRKCAGLKNIENCAYCNDYACEKLMDHFLLDPGPQARLDEIRQLR